MTADDAVDALDALLADLGDHYQCSCGRWHKVRAVRNPFRVSCGCGQTTDVNTSDWPPRGGR